MKANEAPEKVYISDSELNDSEHCIIWFKSQQNEKDIEYIRKDAFIERAKKWFEKRNEWRDINGIKHCDMESFEDFVNYMKGE